MDEAAADAGARRDQSKRDERQHPGADVDRRQADQHAEASGERVGIADLVGNADPADDQRRRGDDDGEEGIPETVRRKVEQAQSVGLAEHQPPGAG